MNCNKVRRYLSPYLDSELTPEVSFEMAQHLESCAECGRRVEGEQRLEQLIRASLGRMLPEDGRAWDRALAGIVGAPARRLGLYGGMAAAASLAALILFVTWRSRGESEADLVVAMRANHEQYMAGQLLPQIHCDDPDEIDAYFEGRFSVLPRISRTGKLSIVGARLCTLGPFPCAFLMGQLGDADISLFFLEPELVSEFPPMRDFVLLRERLDSTSVFAFLDGDRIVCAVGEVDLQVLETVTRELFDRPDKLKQPDTIEKLRDRRYVR